MGCISSYHEGEKVEKKVRQGLVLLLLAGLVVAGDADNAWSVLEHNSALFTAVLILSFLFLTQLLVCILFGYKGWQVKFRPDPPPYSPWFPFPNFLQSSSNNCRRDEEPPPVYVSTEHETDVNIEMSNIGSNTSTTIQEVPRQIPITGGNSELAAVETNI